MGVIVGCSSDDKGGGEGLPPRNTKGDGGETNSSSSSGSTGDSGNGYDCTNHASVDPRPACDQCTRAKCCKQLTDCDNNQACQATFKCVAACADGDTVCVLGCGMSDLAYEFGACISNNCSAECPSSSSDAGFDSPF